MEVIFKDNSGSFEVTAKVTPDRMKLFIDVEPLLAREISLITIGESKAAADVLGTLKDSYLIDVALELASADDVIDVIPAKYNVLILASPLSTQAYTDLCGILVAPTVILVNDWEPVSLEHHSHVICSVGDEPELLVENLDKALYELTLVRDALAASSDIEKLRYHQLLEMLSLKVNTQDIEHGVLKDIAVSLVQNQSTQDRRIKKGKHPKEGHNGKYLYLVRVFTGQGEVIIDEDGSVNLYELNLFDNITAGQVVGRIYPPRPGVDGLDVLGNVIPAKEVTNDTLALGPGLSIRKVSNENYQEIIADDYGYLKEDSNSLTLEQEFVIPGNLDVKYGHIDFVGSVLVKGDILPGFTVKARTRLEVDGVFERGTLVCSEGDVIVRGTAFGGDSSSIVAAGDCHLYTAVGLDVQARGNILVARELANCSLRSAGLLLGENARLFAGTVWAACGLEVKEMGNEVGKLTSVHLCSATETTKEYAQLCEQIQKHEDALEILELHLGGVTENSEILKRLSKEAVEKMEELLRKSRTLKASLSFLEAKREEMLNDARENEISRVNVLKNLHPNVFIHCRGNTYQTQNLEQGPLSITFNLTKGEFELSELLPLECDLKIIDTNGEMVDD